MFYTRVKDSVRHSPSVRESAGWLALIRSVISFRPEARLALGARALGLAESRLLERAAIGRLRPRLADAGKWHNVVSSLPRYRKLFLEQPGLTRSILLKKPGRDGEKGSLLMYFEYNWARLLLGLSPGDLTWFGRHYDIILCTSWSPTDYSILALACARLSGVIFVQASNHSEISRIERLHPRLKCLHSLSCEWIDPDYYRPKSVTDRTTDILMVANWGEFKRHWDLFRALNKMDPALKVVLIGQREGGRGRDFIVAQAQRLGIRQELEVLESVSIEEVTRHQQNAKVSVIMSRREGCCVAAVESLFAGCALALRADAHVGSLAYVNQQTGCRLRPGHIAEDLAALLRDVGKFRPREWATANVSCHKTAEALNAVLRAQAVKHGRPWTTDIITPAWRPYPVYRTERDWDEMRGGYQDLKSRFPIVFSSLFENHQTNA